MGFGLFVVAAGLGAAGYYGYRKLKEIEADVRADLQRKGVAAGENAPGAAKEVSAPASAPASAPETLAGRLLQEVGASPGILQTELYARFPDENRKRIQDVLLTLDREGRVKRTKEKGSYRLDLP